LRVPVFVLIAALLAGTAVHAQSWTPWQVAATLTKDQDGFRSFQCFKGKDSTGAAWQINWAPPGVFVSSPDGQRKNLPKAFPVEAHPEGGMTVSKAGVECWATQGWECLRILIDTGRNGIGLDYFILITIDHRSKDWAVCSGRITDESIEGPDLHGDDLIVRWSDEEEERPLRTNHEWHCTRTQGGILTSKPPVTYQFEYGYPHWFRFWSDTRSPDPDEAEQAGWSSVSWKIATADQGGGTAFASGTAVPKKPGKQVWQKGTGPDIWFPETGTVNFQWAQEVEVRRRSVPVEKVSARTAAELASTGEWNLIIKRDADGTYLGTMLIPQSVKQ